MRILYWKIKYALEAFHFRKYRNKPPEIYYDRRYKEWVHPRLINSHYNTRLEVVGDVFALGFIFPFLHGGDECHVHDFDELIDYAYNSEYSVEIPKEYEQYYSAQELHLIRELNERGSFDRNNSEKSAEY